MEADPTPRTSYILNTPDMMEYCPTQYSYNGQVTVTALQRIFFVCVFMLQKYGHRLQGIHYNGNKLTDARDTASECNADSVYQKFKYLE
jgi:hypothetical protein